MDNRHDVDSIIKCLSMTLGQEYGALKIAEEKLEQMVQEETFYVKLLQIGTNYSLDWSVRWMAMVYLKNGIDRYWRKGGQKEISDSTKQVLKSELEKVMFMESIPKIQIQTAVIVAKIARFDWPNKWDTLLPLLSKNIAVCTDTFTSNTHYCASMTFYHVIKTLASKKLLWDQTNFINLCQQISQSVLLSMDHSQEIMMSHISNENLTPDQLNFVFEIYMLKVKVVPHILEYYICSPQSIITLQIKLLRYLEDLLCCRAIAKEEKSTSLIYKSTCNLIKIMDIALFADQNIYFTCVSQTFTFLCANIINFSLHTNQGNRKFVISLMKLLQKIMMDSNFQVCKESLITDQTHELLYVLIFYYLPLNRDDLELWESDPEDFCNEEVGETWKFNLRPCSEVLMVTLVHQYSNVFVTQLLKILNSVQNFDLQNQSTWGNISDENVSKILQSSSSILEVCLKKEAVYYAIGLAVYEFMESFDFDLWLTTKLLPEVLSLQSENYGKVMHRRVLWLVNKWTGVSPSDKIRSTLYSFVVSSLSSNFDLSVRIYAAVAIQQLLDDFEFDIDQFSFYQEDCFHGLANVLADAKECETKIRVLNSFSFLIERLGPNSKNYGEKILNIISQLWNNAGDHNMLKCVILSTLTQLVNCYANASEGSFVHSAIMPLLQVSTDVNDPSHIYLVEDGLQLWIAILQNAPICTQEVILIFNNMNGLLELSTDILRTCFEIIEAYVLLAGEDFFLSDQANIFSKSLKSALVDVNDECLHLVSRLLLVMLQLSPKHATVVFSWYLEKAFMTLFDMKNGLLPTANMNLFSHIFTTNQDYFWSLIKVMADHCGQKESNVLSKFLDIWCNSVDYITYVEQKKTAGLAMCLMLRNIQNSTIEEHFTLLMCTIVQVLYDVCDENSVDTLVGTDHGTEVFEGESIHCVRMARVKYSQQAFTAALPSQLKISLQQLEYHTSKQYLQKMMAALSPDILNDVNNFISAAS